MPSRKVHPCACLMCWIYPSSRALKESNSSGWASPFKTIHRVMPKAAFTGLLSSSNISLSSRGWHHCHQALMALWSWLFLFPLCCFLDFTVSQWFLGLSFVHLSESSLPASCWFWFLGVKAHSRVQCGMDRALESSFKSNETAENVSTLLIPEALSLLD